jgi:hypothetical protein
MLRLVLWGALFCPLLAFADSAVSGISAKIVLPARPLSSPDLAKLSMSWSNACHNLWPGQLLAFRAMRGAASFKNMDCDALPPEKAADWDTVTVQFTMFNRIWTFEVRESAELFAGLDKESNVVFDLQPSPVEAPPEHVTLRDVKIKFAPGEPVNCSSRIFGVSVRASRPRVKSGVCSFETVTLTEI